MSKLPKKSVQNARTITCPQCGARPGKACRSESGAPVSYAHRERLQAAETSNAAKAAAAIRTTFTAGQTDPVPGAPPKVMRANSASQEVMDRVRKHCNTNRVTAYELSQATGLPMKCTRNLLSGKTNYIKGKTFDALVTYLERIASDTQPTQLPLPGTTQSDRSDVSASESVPVDSAKRSDASVPTTLEDFIPQLFEEPVWQLTPEAMEAMVQEATDALYSRITALEKQVTIQTGQIAEAHQTLLQLVRKVLL